MHPRFPVIDHERKVVLTYDFSVALPAGVSLSGIPTAEVLVSFGVDATASSIVTAVSLVGSSVLLAVSGVKDRTDYDIKVVCETTNAGINMVFTQTLPVRD